MCSRVCGVGGGTKVKEGKPSLYTSKAIVESMNYRLYKLNPDIQAQWPPMDNSCMNLFFLSLIFLYPLAPCKETLCLNPLCFSHRCLLCSLSSPGFLFPRTAVASVSEVITSQQKLSFLLPLYTQGMTKLLRCQ